MANTQIMDMFKEATVLTLEEASQRNKYSIRTAQRQFAKLSVLRSYNKNSRYYTLANTPNFNNNGIWSYYDICFSKYGNLKQTVQNLIHMSERGLSGNEIGEIVKLSPRSFLHHFRNIAGVCREKHNGVYIYFSQDPSTYKKQISKRIQADKIKEINDSIAVILLVEYIKNPNISMQELANRVRDKKSCYVSALEIESFFAFHNLLKKKPERRQ